MSFSENTYKPVYINHVQELQRYDRMSGDDHIVLDICTRLSTHGRYVYSIHLQTSTFSFAHTPSEVSARRPHTGRSAHASVEALMPPGRGAHAPVCTDPPVFYSVPVYLLSCSLPFSSRIPVSNASLTGTHNSLMHLLGFTYALLITSHSIRGLAFPSPRAHYSRAYASVEL